MIHRDYLVIGAGAAGDAACEGIRSYDKKGSILLAGFEPLAPYDRQPLSKEFLSAAKVNPDNLALRAPEFYQKNKIDFRPSTMVTQLNLERHVAVLSTGQGVEFNKGCLAMGSRARRPVVAGAQLGNVFYLRNLGNALAIREVLTKAMEVVVVGGGYLAAEAAASLHARGCKVTILESADFLWQDRLDAKMSEWFTEHVRSLGIEVLTRESINGFEGKTVLRNIQTKSGNRLNAQVAIVALGAEPNLDLVANTPLATPLGTPVNELLETEEKGIYAAGDIALYPNKVFGGMARTQHWEHAQQMGLTAGINMTARKRTRFVTVPRFRSVVGDLTMHFIGDFQRPPGRMEVEGDLEKRNFTLRAFNGAKLHGVILCNRKKWEEEAAVARQEILSSFGIKGL